MLLTLSTTYHPATDLGYLLHKNPSRHQVTELSIGKATVFYPEVSEDRCTAALLIDVDPIELVRGNRGRSRNDFVLAQYVNDRPYAASSFMSVAIAKVFGTAMNGRSKERQELADQPIPLEVNLPVVPCREGSTFLQELFGPLGYEVELTQLPLDEHFPAWGPSRYFSVHLAITERVQSVLEHLYVLLPVLDDDKHYWVGPDEVEKLLRRAGGWLAAHPARDAIARRYLRHDRIMVESVLTQLRDEDSVDPDEAALIHDSEEEAVEAPIHLNDQRIAEVIKAIRASGARRVLDLGCGSGKLVAALLKETDVEKIVAMDVSYGALKAASRRLHVDTMAPRQKDRIELLHGSLIYRDRRLQGYDLAAAIEVIEHLDESRLGNFERTVFGMASPSTVIVTTPNSEYNQRFTGLPAGTLRHRDHRFEWNRSQFADWTDAVASRHGYRVEVSGIGPVDQELGSPTQMAVFSR